ncbi:MAG: ATP-binding protein [Erysipelotrichaceae bacterium]|nr:ATP-binding protein [Erysipelotrichaceae bacterium]
MKQNNLQMIRKLMFRLLPIQVLLAVVGSVNDIVSSYFASNFCDIEVMSAVGLFGPADMLLGAISTMLAGGVAIICGKLLGQNEIDKIRDVFALNTMVAMIIGILFTAVLAFMGATGMTGFFTQNEALRPTFNRFLLIMSASVIPTILGNQLPAFLTMQNKSKRTMYASIAYIITNLILCYLFVCRLDWEELGLALSSVIGMWVFLAVESSYFLSGKSEFRFKLMKIDWKEVFRIIAVGFPGAAGLLYMTGRGLIVNKLLDIHTGSAGLSAFTAANNLLSVFWAIPGGMMTVSRLQMSVSIGEEDRRSLCDIMRVMFRYFIPLMCAIDAVIILLARPLAGLFFHDTGAPVYQMMVSGLRILPLCMPFSIICQHFTSYGQASGKQLFVNILSLLDGVVCVAGFSIILTGWLKVNGVYVANVLNGIVTTLFIIGHAWLKNRHFPRNMEQLMVIPADFGAAEDERIDITVMNMEEVINLSKRIMDFCQSRGIDKRRSYFSALALEEMAGNIVEHGFTKDDRKHSINVRVVHKDDSIILRIKDDCIPFNPEERRMITENDDITKNMGIRMVYSILKDINYNYLFGINCLTIRI